MQVVQQFDPTLSTEDKFSVPQSSATGTMVIWNESNVGLTISFQNGYSTYVPAWVANAYKVPVPNVEIVWAQTNVLNSVAAPLQIVTIEMYDDGEQLPAAFPVALSRQINLGNSVPLGTSATSIQNDGNPGGTPIVEATVNGDVASAVQLSNDGVLVLGDDAHRGNIVLNRQGVQISLGPNIFGNLSLAGGGLDITASGTQLNNTLTAGYVSVVNELFLATGKISGISKFTGSGNGTVNHGLGAVPDIIFFVGLTATPASFSYTGANATAVTVHTSAAVAWAALAIKF